MVRVGARRSLANTCNYRSLELLNQLEEVEGERHRLDDVLVGLVLPCRRRGTSRARRGTGTSGVAWGHLGPAPRRRVKHQMQSAPAFLLSLGKDSSAELILSHPSVLIQANRRAQRNSPPESAPMCQTGPHTSLLFPGPHKILGSFNRQKARSYEYLPTDSADTRIFSGCWIAF